MIESAKLHAIHEHRVECLLMEPPRQRSHRTRVSKEIFMKGVMPTMKNQQEDLESKKADDNVHVWLQGRNITSRGLWEEGKNQLCDIFYHIFNVYYTFILKPKFYKENANVMERGRFQILGLGLTLFLWVEIEGKRTEEWGRISKCRRNSYGRHSWY